MKASSLRTRLEGWALVLTLIGLCYLLLAPRISGILENREAVHRANERISEYTARLAAPPPPDQYEGYRQYITQSSPDADMAALSGTLQAAIIERVKARKGRLIDLRETSSPTTVEGLAAVSFRLEIEGDIQTALETVADIGSLPAPVLIQDLELRPAGAGRRAEERMRLVLTLTAWTGDIG
jgi:hypothetical protein